MAGFLKRLGFQCWRRFHTPRDVVGRWLPSRIEVPVIIGDVVIDPGDFLLGDEDGMVRVPRGIADEVKCAARNPVIGSRSPAPARTVTSSLPTPRL